MLPRTRDGDGARTAIVRALRQVHERDQRPPSLRQLADATGLGETTIRYHLTYLERHGVVRNLGGPHGWMLVRRTE